MDNLRALQGSSLMTRQLSPTIPISDSVISSFQQLQLGMKKTTTENRKTDIAKKRTRWRKHEKPCVNNYASGPGCQAKVQPQKGVLC